MQPELIVITGPTATGKSDIAVRLAKKINGEVISADSMQIYKYMNIGTAKITTDEMLGIKHYLIDELYPDENFSVAAFKERASQYIGEIQASSKIPILVGGTGFYLNSVLYDNDFTAGAPDDEYRESLYSEAARYGNVHLHNMLAQTDPEAARAIHFNNVKRVVRALEYYKQTGQKISGHNSSEKERGFRYNTAIFIMNMDRAILYRRIDARVDIMLERGLVKEVEGLLGMGYHKNLISMQGIGYAETIKYLEGEISLEDAAEMIKRETRRYAKRQSTWFRNQLKAAGNWINVDESDNKAIIVNDIIAACFPTA